MRFLPPRRPRSLKTPPALAYGFAELRDPSSPRSLPLCGLCDTPTGAPRDRRVGCRVEKCSPPDEGQQYGSLPPISSASWREGPSRTVERSRPPLHRRRRSNAPNEAPVESLGRAGPKALRKNFSRFAWDSSSERSRPPNRNRGASTRQVRGLALPTLREETAVSQLANPA